MLVLRAHDPVFATEEVRTGRVEENQVEAEKAWYVIRYYGHLMTTQERIARKHLMATAKAMHGRTDVAAQT